MTNLRAATYLMGFLCCMAAGAFAAESVEGGEAPAPAPRPAPRPTTPAPAPTTPKPAPPEAAEESEVRRAPEGVPSLRMATDFAAPGMSFGTYAPLGQVESRGVRVDPFTVRAAINAGIGYTDNVAASHDNKTSSAFLSVSPSVAVGLEGALQRYYAVYRGSYGRFVSSSENNFDDHSIGLSAANDWATRFRSLLDYEFVRGHTVGGLISTTLARPVEWDTHSVRGTATYGARGAQANIEGAVSYRTWRYVTDRDLTASSDYDQFDLGGTFSYRLAPKTRALAQITYGDITHPSAALLDNTEMRYMVGATWDALATTTGTLRAGITTKKFDNASFSDFSGASFEGSVRWAPRTYSVVDFSGRRFLSEAYISGASFVVNTYLGLTWNHDWPRGYRSTFSYSYGQSSFQGVSRSDTYQDVGLRASYGIKPSLRVGAEVRHDTRSSDAGGLSYNRNTVLVIVETAI